MAFSHPNLEVARMIYPGPYALEAIERKPSVRSFPLSDLPILKGKCCWCNALDIQPPKRRYCSDACVEAAVLFCHPQSPRTKMYILLQLQDCTCVGCGEIFDEQIRTIIEATLERRVRWKKLFPKESFAPGLEAPITLNSIGQNTGHLWQVDHIIPIFRGGRGVCIENLQVLCVNCHRKKTARERRHL